MTAITNGQVDPLTHAAARVITDSTGNTGHVITATGNTTALMVVANLPTSADAKISAQNVANWIAKNARRVKTMYN